MTTIPARDIVQVNPGVLPAGGSALDIIGLFLTSSWRVPVGTVQAFGDAADVFTFFGANSTEGSLATIYFNGFTNCHKLPGSLLFAQYNQGSVSAYLLGASVAALTIQQIQAISGTLTVIVDGYPRAAAALNLSSATSFSSAATLIQTALNAGGANPNVASTTAGVSAATSSFTGYIAGNLLYVTAVGAGTLVAGTTITGTSIAASTIITGQVAGTTGGVGTYTVNNNQVVSASTSISGTYGILNVSAVSSGTLSVGQTISGTNVVAGTQITQLGTGTGLTGSYFVNNNAAVASTTVSALGTPVTVTFDSTSGGFLINSGVVVGGASSTMAYATGTTADPLNLRQADGAKTSQGSAGQTPVAFMNSITVVTQDWATFMTMIDPDYATSSIQKQMFSSWVNGTNNQYAYVAWDTDITPTSLQPDASSFGEILASENSSGTYVHWVPDNIQGPIKAAFICGMGAAIDFTQKNGRITFAFKSQTGLIADVTTESVAHNLGGDPQSIGSRGNNYNFYGAYATRNEQFVFENRGFISGPFLWMDSYINQIWLNNALQLSLMVLLTTVYSIPYNQAGYALIEAACLDPINAAINFGAIRQNINLSQSQLAEVAFQSGLDLSVPLQTQGWFLQIGPTQPQVRAARASPPCTLWYTDGQSVQAITLASIEIQ